MNMMPSALPEDPTVEEVRIFLAPHLAAQAAFDGWSESAVLAAADTLDVDQSLALLAFRDGPVDMITAWFRSIDAAMELALPPEVLTAMKIRERIRALVVERLTILQPDREGLRRAQAILAMPHNVPRAARLGWHTADLMWRMAGDTATDYNHYTKRAILTALYASVLGVFLDDQSDDLSETMAFLERRIDNVMQFEKAKAKFVNRQTDGFSFARLAGRLRYPGR